MKKTPEVVTLDDGSRYREQTFRNARQYPDAPPV